MHEHITHCSQWLLQTTEDLKFCKQDILSLHKFNVYKQVYIPVVTLDLINECASCMFLIYDATLMLECLL